jgi:Protein of unknown function (DUF3558)
VIRPVVLAVTCAATALAVAGCGGGTTGTASPGAATTTTSADASTTSASAKADVDPCTLLSASEVSQIGITVANQKTHPDSKTTSCEWAAHAGAPALVVSFRPTLGMDELNNSQATSVTKVTINGRQVDEALVGPNNLCSVAIPISAHSSASVVASGKAGGTGACGWAEQMAKIVAPKVQTS